MQNPKQSYNARVGITADTSVRVPGSMATSRAMRLRRRVQRSRRR